LIAEEGGDPLVPEEVYAGGRVIRISRRQGWARGVKESSIRYTGMRWRTSADAKLKRFNIGVHVHRAKKGNAVWYDDVVLSTGYIGPNAE